MSKQDIITALSEKEPIFFRAKNSRYIAITTDVSIVFAYENKTAKIITAYQSSKWQKKLYKKKRK